MLCVNLMDEAKRKGIEVDLETLEAELSIPVIGTVARDKKSIKTVKDTLDRAVSDKTEKPKTTDISDILNPNYEFDGFSDSNGVIPLVVGSIDKE